MAEKDPRTLFNVFASTQETFEEAKRKSSEESSKRASYFRIQKDGTYPIRILPLAPEIDADGNALPMERKGYEYPIRSLMLKIDKGSNKIDYVTVCNAKYVFGERLENDLIDVYVKTACDKYADDEKLCKKLREGSFNGGLKWDSRRCMYIIDTENPGDGIQILQLSYAQYKDLEERKLQLWAKLNKNGKKPCPISSIDGGYPVEITRKTENGKASYSFNIDTVSGVQELTEEELQALLDTPRLPSVLYRYTKFHLEATEVYLSQLDEKFDIEVMDSKEVQDCIAQLKSLISPDDTSHYSLAGSKENTKNLSPAEELDELIRRQEELEDAGLDDRSEDGQELRGSIRDFIEKHNLGVKIPRGKTNAEVLDELDELIAAPQASKPLPKEEDEDLEEEDEPSVPEEEAEETPDEPFENAPRRRSRNEDTNEPAERATRRERTVSRRR